MSIIALLLYLTVVVASGKQEDGPLLESFSPAVSTESKQPATLDYAGDTPVATMITSTGIMKKTEEAVMKSTTTTATAITTTIKSSEMMDNQSTSRSIDTTTVSINANVVNQKVDVEETGGLMGAEDKPKFIPLNIDKKTLTGTGSMQRWIVQEGNCTCIVLEMLVQLKISYLKMDNKKTSVTLNLSGQRQSRSSGHCGEKIQNITISWGSDIALTLQFGKNESSARYGLDRIEATLSGQNFPEWKLNKTAKLAYNADMMVGRQFVVGLRKSYRCEIRQILNLNSTESDVEMEGQFRVSELQLEAFKMDNSSEFDQAEDCIFDTPDVVPIAVGCALAGLVLVVLMAYLVARRRNYARGYYSM
ncbi:hypothetical protein KM043_014370 [Ampulex compressa]|nr:hypothetical protein KM043_014370 [Ampulex compressa]